MNEGVFLALFQPFSGFLYSPSRKHYNQEVFAKMLKLSRASIVNIEKGRQRPTLHLLYEICKITEYNLFDLLPQLKSGEELESKWKVKVAQSISRDSKSEKNLSNFLLHYEHNRYKVLSSPF